MRTSVYRCAICTLFERVKRTMSSGGFFCYLKSIALACTVTFNSSTATRTSLFKLYRVILFDPLLIARLFVSREQTRATRRYLFNLFRNVLFGISRTTYVYRSRGSPRDNNFRSLPRRPIFLRPSKTTDSRSKIFIQFIPYRFLRSST